MSSFSFGSGSTGFGTQQNTGFGTNQNTGFGTQGTTGFGTQPTAGFGTQPTTGFGAQPTTGFGTQPTSGFGAQQTAGFGATQSAGFGTPQSTSFGFGTSTATTTGSTGFSFGSNAAPTTSSGFSFGSSLATTTTTSTLGFGSSTGGLFGSKPAFSTSGFGTGTGGLFSTPKTTASTGFGTNTFKPFGQTPQNTFQNPQQNVDPNVSLYLAVCAPTVFNDERDETIKKWNQLQAVWGHGKGFYAPNLPPVDFTPDNPFCKFKAVGYVKLPTYSSEDGFVELTIAQKESDVRKNQQQIVDVLVKAFEGCQVCVDYVQAFGEKTRLCMYVQQRSPNGETKKAQAWQVYTHFNSPNMKQTVQNLCIESVAPLVALTDGQLKEYLEAPPQGIDPMIWEQGKRANPDPKKYLPVAMVGFRALKERFKSQEDEARLLQGQLDSVAEEITTMQGKQAKLLADLQECKRKQTAMAHRVLKLVIKQEVNRKRGVPIEVGEEHLRMMFESLHAQLSTPTQYMGRLNELLSQISVQSGTNGSLKMSAQPTYTIDSQTEKDINQFLTWEQNAIKEMVSLIKDDFNIVQNMSTPTQKS